MPTGLNVNIAQRETELKVPKILNEENSTMRFTV